MRPWCRRAVAVFVLALFWGCGGGKTTTTPTGSTGTLRGTLGTQASGATVKLEGTSRQVQCGANGDFTLSGVPAGEYTLSVTSAGGTGTAVVVRVLPDQTTDVPPVTLDADGQISGLVHGMSTGGKSTPLAGARVLVRPMPYLYAYAGTADSSVVNGVTAAGGTVNRQTTDTSGEPAPRVAITDAAGSYHITAVASGAYSVEVSADGYISSAVGTWVAPGSTGVADVTLQAIDPNRATLSGTVQTQGSSGTQPLAYVRVELWPAGANQPVPMAGAGSANGTSTDPWYMPPFINSYVTFTDANGQYELTNITPGSYSLSVSRYGYAAQSRSLTLSNSQKAVADFVMVTNLATISGTVYGKDGNGNQTALAGAWVSAYGYVVGPYYGVAATVSGSTGAGSTGGVGNSSGGGNTGGGSTGGGVIVDPLPWSVQTDAQGHYTLQSQIGPCVVGAWADGYNYGYTDLQLTSAGATGVDIVLDKYDGKPIPVPLASQVARRKK